MERSAPPSTIKTMQAVRSGHHATVYEVRRDPSLKNKDVIRDPTKKVFPFVGGSNYKGSWNMDQKEGFGVQVNPNNTKYEGEWANNKHNGRGTLWVKKGKSYIRQYVGDWADGEMDGQGVYYYDDGSIYKGGWLRNKRSNEGRCDYNNGDHYVGEWANDLQEGLGSMSYVNGNIYEGLWAGGKKEGPGLFYYASTKKMYQGEWHDDQPRCGEFRSPTPDEEQRFVRLLPKGLNHNDFKLPGLTLADPNEVIDIAVSDVRMNSVHRNEVEEGTRQSYIRPYALEKAHKVFKSVASKVDKQVISIYRLSEVLFELGLDLNASDVAEITSQLELKDTLDISFAEAVEIASYIHEQKQAAHHSEFNY